MLQDLQKNEVEEAKSGKTWKKVYKTQATFPYLLLLKERKGHKSPRTSLKPPSNLTQIHVLFLGLLYC